MTRSVPDPVTPVPRAAAGEAARGCGCAIGSPPVNDRERRTLLIEALALTALVPLAAGLPASARAQSSRARKPEPGDRFAYMTGDNEDKTIAPEALKVGAEPVLAYPVDRDSGEVLKSRANLITLARVEVNALKPASARNAADGIVAFSSLCTHAGCPITVLHSSQTQLVCNCHGSTFDAANRGAVTQGPATRRLAMLPVEIKDGVLVIAGKFDGPLGPPT